MSQLRLPHAPTLHPVQLQHNPAGALGELCKARPLLHESHAKSNVSSKQKSPDLACSMAQTQHGHKHKLLVNQHPAPSVHPLPLRPLGHARSAIVQLPPACTQYACQLEHSSAWLTCL